MPRRVHANHPSQYQNDSDVRKVSPGKIQQIKVSHERARKTKLLPIDVVSVFCGISTYAASALFLFPKIINYPSSMPLAAMAITGGCIGSKAICQYKRNKTVDKAALVYAGICGVVSTVGLAAIGGIPLLIAEIAGTTVGSIASFYERRLQIEEGREKKRENYNQIVAATAVVGASAMSIALSGILLIKNWFSF